MTKTFILKVVDDGESMTMTSHNDGFNPCEIVAYLELKKLDLADQMCNRTKFTRTAKLDDTEYDITRKEDADDQT